MTIKAIIGKNFLPYKQFRIRLHEGVNIFKGKTHHGKTSIHRLLKWIITNKPSGDAYRNWFVKKSAIVSGKILFDDRSEIERFKDFENGYKLNGKSYRAIGSDIPDEIQEVLRLDQDNIQSQHDGFFWLNDSPGQVAKDINEAIGLSKIDQSLSEIDSIVRDTKLSIAATKEYLDEKKDELKTFRDTDTIDDIVKEIESKVKDRETLKIKRDNLLSIIRSIEGINIECYDRTIGFKNEFAEIEKELDRLRDMRRKALNLSNMISSISKQKDVVKRKMDIIKKETDGYNAILKKENYCPICGTKMTNKKGKSKRVT